MKTFLDFNAHYPRSCWSSANFTGVDTYAKDALLLMNLCSTFTYSSTYMQILIKFVLINPVNEVTTKATSSLKLKRSRLAKFWPFRPTHRLRTNSDLVASVQLTLQALIWQTICPKNLKTVQNELGVPKEIEQKLTKFWDHMLVNDHRKQFSTFPKF